MQYGVHIQEGPADWQVLQQVWGKAEIRLAGEWCSPDPVGEQGVSVRARLVEEDTGRTVVGWVEAQLEGARWEAVLRNIPAGGLYRIETCLDDHPEDIAHPYYAKRGDMIHHIGVGDIWVIAGQSNAAGFGMGEAYDPPELGVHMLRANGRWELGTHPLNDSTGTVHPENRDLCNARHSPFLTFAKRLKRVLGYPIGLIPTALGAVSIDAYTPPEGPLYRLATRLVREQGGRVRGVLWYQGCCEASAHAPEKYHEAFACLVEEFRRKVGEPALPFLVMQLNRHTDIQSEPDGRYWGLLREYQRRAAHELAEVFVTPTLDLRLSDEIHNGAQANMMLGERLANLALARVYRRRSGAAAPEIASAQMEGTERLCLEFRNVECALLLQQQRAEESPFTVEDDEGEIPITGWEAAIDTIYLTLSRAPHAGARVHGMWQTNPSFGPPYDTGSQLPMLAFYGVPVEEAEQS